MTVWGVWKALTTAAGYLSLVAVWLIAIVAVLVQGAYPAHADPVSPQARQYATTHAATVCNILALDPSVATVETLVIVGVKDGLTGYQSGEAIGLSVYGVRPSYGYLLDAYIDKWAPARTPAPITAGVGGVIR